MATPVFRVRKGDLDFWVQNGRLIAEKGYFCLGRDMIYSSDAEPVAPAFLRQVDSLPGGRPVSEPLWSGQVVRVLPEGMGRTFRFEPGVPTLFFKDDRPPVSVTPIKLVVWPPPFSKNPISSAELAAIGSGKPPFVTPAAVKPPPVTPAAVKPPPVTSATFGSFLEERTRILLEEIHRPPAIFKPAAASETSKVSLKESYCEFSEEESNVPSYPSADTIGSSKKIQSFETRLWNQFQEDRSVLVHYHNYARTTLYEKFPCFVYIVASPDDCIANKYKVGCTSQDLEELLRPYRRVDPTKKFILCMPGFHILERLILNHPKIFDKRIQHEAQPGATRPPGKSEVVKMELSLLLSTIESIVGYKVTSYLKS